MPLLSTAEITDMRSEQTGTLPDTVVIWRYTTASDGMGGNTESWTAAGTVVGRLAVPGRRSGDEGPIAERLTASDPWLITMPYNTTVYERDRLFVGSRTFEIEYISEHGEWETARQAYGYEVGG